MALNTSPHRCTMLGIGFQGPGVDRWLLASCCNCGDNELVVGAKGLGAPKLV